MQAFVPEEEAGTGKSVPCAPYSNDELAHIVEWATSCGTPRSRADATAIVALGVGAGLSRVEMMGVTYADLTVRRGVVLVRVSAGRYADDVRDIPMTEPWGTILIEAVSPFAKGGYTGAAAGICAPRVQVGGVAYRGLEATYRRRFGTGSGAVARDLVGGARAHQGATVHPVPAYRTSLRRAIVRTGVMESDEFKAWQRGVKGSKDV